MFPDGSLTDALGATVPDQTQVHDDSNRQAAANAFANIDFTTLALTDLRDIRRQLTEREHQVSYWRRIIQARLDLLREGAAPRGTTVEGLHRILSQQMGTNSRKGMLKVRPDQDQPMAGLDHLWHRSINGNEDDLLEADLRQAEHQLSIERTRLFGLIDAATAELISRYREDPMLALSALPHRTNRPSPL